MLLVAVGSKNPTKVEATRRVFRRAFGRVKVIGLEVNSGVSPQPMSASESIRGAINRAKRAIEISRADFGVGIEGGTARLCGRWFTAGFVAVIGRDGRISLGTSGWFECPAKVVEEMKKGRELAEVIGELTGRKDVKEGEGAIGIFTRGHVSRTNLYEHGVWMALCRFLSPQIFLAEFTNLTLDEKTNKPC